MNKTECESYEINIGDVILTPNRLKHSLKPVGDEAFVLQTALIEMA